MSDEYDEYNACVSEQLYDRLDQERADDPNIESIVRSSEHHQQILEECGERPKPESFSDKYDRLKDEMVSWFSDSAEGDQEKHLTAEDKDHLINEVMVDVLSGKYDLSQDDYKNIQQLRVENDPVWAKNADFNEQLLDNIEATPEAFIEGGKLPEVEVETPEVTALTR